jgi:hypothetical protein
MAPDIKTPTNDKKMISALIALNQPHKAEANPDNNSRETYPNG